MRYLSLEEVLLIHELVVERSGGAPGRRDLALLDSAAKRPQATFSGRDLCPDLFTKGAALGQSLIRNHPFVDGNKRTAWEAMRSCLEENGPRLHVGPNEIVEFVLLIAEGVFRPRRSQPGSGGAREGDLKLGARSWAPEKLRLLLRKSVRDNRRRSLLSRQRARCAMLGDGSQTQTNSQEERA